MRTYQFIVGASEAGLRLDRYLARHLPLSVSRAMIQRTIRAGRVTVSARPLKVHQKLREGERIVAHVEELPSRGGDTPLVPQDIPLEIVYEDPHLLVVNKPAGLVTHPAPGHWDGTLVNAILWHLQEARSWKLEAGKGNVQSPASSLQPPTSSLESPLPRAGIVHRLDKDTSGLLIVAKTERVHAALSDRKSVV